MHCIAALAVLKQFWCRVIKRLRITLLCPWCYYILWWLSSIKIYKIGGSEALKQWLSSIRIIRFVRWLEMDKCKQILSDVQR